MSTAARSWAARQVAELVTGAVSDSAKVTAIHSYVQQIPFGWTTKFDAATPEETIALNRGHCNPKTRLFVELCREAGLKAHQHWVNIDNQVLGGLGDMFPPRVTHSFADVQVDGVWRRVDSYIVDPKLAGPARKRLTEEGRELGYGLHSKGVTTFDGSSDAFSQMACDSMILEDLGQLDWEEVAQHPSYLNRIGPFNVSTVLRWLPGVNTFFSTAWNKEVIKLQAEASG
ncbi:unnamed protein product [Effrenium voratum]|nr:unnamed protein product [Effrenium voratum]